MVYYCDQCFLIYEQKYCQFCGKTDLRNPNKNDYCFLVEVNSMFGEMLKGIFDSNEIPYSDIPVGTGVRSIFALKLENLKIFVPYGFFDRANELLNDILLNLKDELSRDLKNNTGKIFASPRNEKKFRKILKLAESDTLIAYCLDMITNADSFADKGRISGCTKGGNYLFVYKDERYIIVNSATYEIISVK